MNTKKEIIKLDKNIQTNLDSMTTTSGRIRYLTSLGHSQGDIARKLKIRPQHVNNVLKTSVKTPKDIIPTSKKK
ncbi:MAG: hypothetical protein COA78_28480 [Blastopirellula sp.]|nr:MAG: hypothetical protein COA78_28480 [Blastopirellula sp.]